MYVRVRFGVFPPSVLEVSYTACAPQAGPRPGAPARSPRSAIEQVGAEHAAAVVPRGRVQGRQTAPRPVQRWRAG